MPVRWGAISTNMPQVMPRNQLIKAPDNMQAVCKIGRLTNVNALFSRSSGQHRRSRRRLASIATWHRERGRLTCLQSSTILRPSAVHCASIASIRGAHVMRICVIVLGCCLAGPSAALGQVTIINPPVAGAPLSPFPPPQYNLPGPQLVVPQPGNPLQQVATLPSLAAPPGSPIPQLSPLGSTVNPLQPAPGSTVNGFSPALGVNPAQQLGLQSALQPGLPEAY
jgi:hypothetical protein